MQASLNLAQSLEQVLFQPGPNGTGKEFGFLGVLLERWYSTPMIAGYFAESTFTPAMNAVLSGWVTENLLYVFHVTSQPKWLSLALQNTGMLNR